jgi:hypothetical protein
MKSRGADDGAAARKRSVADPDAANDWPIWAVDDNALPTTAVAVVRIATVVIASADQTETQSQSDTRVSPTPASATSERAAAEAGTSEPTADKTASTAPNKTAATTPNKTPPASPDKSTAPTSTTRCKRASGGERDTDDGCNDEQELPIHCFLHGRAGDWGLRHQAGHAARCS